MEILKLFKYRVNHTPNNVCLYSPEIEITFNVLDKYSNEIANQILSKTNKDIIPIYIDDDIYVLPVVLSIMKAGKVPLPLTTSLPYNQSIGRISEVDYDLVISNNLMDLQNVMTIPKWSEFEIEEKIEDVRNSISFKDSDIAYIICTSGSTGVPKKVFLSHRNINWLLNEFYSLVNFSTESTFLFTTPYTFDVSLTELFAPIVTGGKLCCFRKFNSIEKMKSTIEYVKKYKITHLSLPPTYAELLVDTADIDDFSNLDFICLAGEKFEVRLSNKFLRIIDRGTQVLNLYGPSETTIYSTFYKVSGKEVTEVPIGSPITGCKFKIINQNKEESRSGELYIGGKGVSLGYLLDSDLKKELFIEIDSESYYKTGDFVHLNSINELVFDNRKDGQIKINGIRVELGEIENEVLILPEIRQCKVVFENKKIFIFYKTDFDEKICNNKIKERLPKYISPVMIKVPDFIVNQNRKFDSKEMIRKYFSENEKKIENRISREIAELLGQVGATSFDDMDSIKIVRFFLEVEEKFNITIPDKMIPGLINIEDLINYIENQEKSIIATTPSNIESDKTNLQMTIDNYLRLYDLEEKLIPTMFMQKQYNIKGYSAVLSIDFEYNNFNYEGIIRLQDTLKTLAKDIDVLKMLLIKEKDTLYFKKITENSFVPIIYLMSGQVSEEFIREILYSPNNKTIPQFITIAYPHFKKVSIYFSHNIMDKSSLSKFSKLFRLCLKNPNHMVTSGRNYEDFINFVKKKNRKTSIREIFKELPDTSYLIPQFRKHVDGRALMMESKIVGENSISISKEVAYKVAQYLFSIDKNSNIVTGSYIANIRHFDNFEAEDIVGDMHINVPFIISSSTTYEDFDEQATAEISKIISGKFIRDKIFDGYPQFSGYFGKAKQKLESLNVSINYIGEVNDVDATIQESFDDKYPKKYILAFTNKSRLFVIIFNDTLLPTKFNTQLKDYVDTIEVKDIVSLV
ncbi:TPA: AMP-binding protein [Streptococcus suis]